MDSKSVVSSSSASIRKKESEFSLQTIVNKIDKDMTEIIGEVPSKIHKQILQSINDSLKILYKKINSRMSLSSGLGGTTEFDVINLKREIEKLKEENETLRTNFDSEIIKLKSEHEKYKNTHSSETSEKENNFASHIEKLNLTLSEEKNANQQLNKQIKTIEDILKTVNTEYKMLKERFDKMECEFQLLENEHNDLKRIYNESKNKINDLKKVNTDLKHKIVEADNSLRLHSDDFKQFVKKHVNLQRKFEEIEKNKEKMFHNLCYKEEKLKALRYMNGKLEQKSKEIIEKWNEVIEFQGKVSQLTTDNTQMVEVIEKLKVKITEVTDKNMKLTETCENLKTGDKNFSEEEYSKKEEYYNNKTSSKENEKLMKDLGKDISSSKEITINLNKLLTKEKAKTYQPKPLVKSK